MTVQEKLYTADDLWAMPGEGKRYELVKGEIIEMAGTGGVHTVLEARMARLLGNFVDEHDLGYVTGASGAYRLSSDPDTVRIPDAAFIGKARMPSPLPEKFIPAAPDLAVEIVSPGDSALEIREKVLEYLQAGTRLVWVIYPEVQSADVFTAVNAWHVVDKNGALEGGEVLPGFSLPLQTVFQNVK
jgi:Uma2 family endonuclease